MERMQFTIFFEDPFWIGLIERSSEGCAHVGRVVFGAEPSNAQIVAFVRDGFDAIPLMPVEGRLPGPARTPVEWATSRALKSLQLYKAALCTAKKEAAHARNLATKDAAYLMRREKRKKKRNGH